MNGSLYSTARAPGAVHKQNTAPQGEAARTGALKNVPHMVAFYPRRPSAHMLVDAVGNMLYALGFAAEYQAVQLWRVLRNVLSLIAQVVAWLLTTLFGWVAGLAAGLWRDVTEPFRRLLQQRKQLQKLRQRAQRFGYSQAEVPGLVGGRVRHSLRILSLLVAFVLPLAAAGALVLTVRNVLTLRYALEVRVNGQPLGYVADQGVVESAKSLLRDRIRLAGNQSIEDWQFSPSYSIARAAEYTTTRQLVNKILLSGSKNPGDIVEGTGLYIDGNLVAVTQDGERLKSYLDNYLAEQQAAAPDNGVVSYRNALEYDPAAEDVFFAGSVLSWDKMQEKLASNLAEGRFVVANGEDNLAQIAVDNNISLEVLLQRNPALNGLNGSDVPEAGRSLRVWNAQPLLQVQTAFMVPGREVLPFKTVELPDSGMAFGTRIPDVRGVDGWQEVVDEYIWVDGENVAVERVSETVVQQPVNAVVRVGTNEATAVGPDEYIFPVPSSVRSSRGKSYGHRGVDINAPTGEPIFACQAGTVVTAGWHYSYGYYVIIKHDTTDQHSTLYAHCSQLYVQAGDKVERGAPIAALGSTGNSSGPHLHLEVHSPEGALLNPKDFITPPPGYNYHWS